jgi:hypothetical protein
MIGPHEGQELELLLNGNKPLAVFMDVVPESGDIDERIIPEKTFAPYVQSGRLIRIARQMKDEDGSVLQYVCFTPPDQIWRAKSYLWLHQLIHTRQIEYTDQMDILFGRLLGYTKADIQDFIPFVNV